MAGSPSKKLLGLLDKLLAERRKPIGTGWPEVTPEDMGLLHDVVQQILEEKFSRDCDGDMVISYDLTDRSRFETPHHLPVPHDRDGQSAEDDEEVLRLLIANAHTVTERLSSALDIRRHRRGGRGHAYPEQVVKKILAPASPPAASEGGAMKIDLKGGITLGPGEQLVKIGFWRKAQDGTVPLGWDPASYAGLPWPGDLVRADQPEDVKQLIARYLRAGAKGTVRSDLAGFNFGDGYKGFSSCRLCGKLLGSTDSTDGTYVWPTQLEHYVLEHDVWLGNKFLDHVKRNGG